MWGRTCLLCRSTLRVAAGERVSVGVDAEMACLRQASDVAGGHDAHQSAGDCQGPLQGPAPAENGAPRSRRTLAAASAPAIAQALPVQMRSSCRCAPACPARSCGPASRRTRSARVVCATPRARATCPQCACTLITYRRSAARWTSTTLIRCKATLATTVVFAVRTAGHGHRARVHGERLQ